MRSRPWFSLLALAVLTAAALAALTAPLGGDYPGPPCATCDYPGPAIDALLHGRVHDFFAVQPVMGSFSLLLRAPFAGAARLLGGGELWEYRAGALACLLFAAGLAWHLGRGMAAEGRNRFAQAAVAGLCVVSPLAFTALRWGHPEEVLGAALCVGAVLLSARGRPRTAGVALGLALATKQWAWLACLPVLMVAPGRRARTLLVAVGVAAALTLPMAMGDPGRFTHLIRAFGIAGTGLTPINVWWGYGHLAGITVDPHGSHDAFSLPAILGAAAHPLVVVVALGLTVACWLRRRPELDVSDVLGLLALLFLLRCLLDPLAYSYHHAPFLLALAAHEGLRRRGLPLLTGVVSIAVWAMGRFVAPMGDPNALNRAYLAWAVPLAAYLAYRTLSSRARSRPLFFARRVPGTPDALPAG